LDMAEADSDTAGSLQLEAKEALLPRSERIREAVCGQNGLLAWACLSTFLVFVFGITLVRECSESLNDGAQAAQQQRTKLWF